jgi:stringent starvation protein B
MDVRETETKKSVLAELLEQGMVLVTLDARQPGVDVPPHLIDDAQLRLNLSYRFGLPMNLDDWGVVATLTFAGTPYVCRLPWTSIYLLVSHVTGRPILFPADVPPEFFPAGEGQDLAGLTAPSRARSARPRLQVVTEAGGEGAATVTATAAAAVESSEPAAEAITVDSDAPKTPPRRGHLRVVK